MKNLVEFINESSKSFKDMLTKVIEDDVAQVMTIKSDDDKGTIYLWLGQDSRFYGLYAKNNWSEKQCFLAVFPEDLGDDKYKRVLLNAIDRCDYDSYMSKFARMVKTDKVTRNCQVMPSQKLSQDVLTKLESEEEK